MRHGSLFSGIGGFDLAADWMGWENIFHCEWNPFCQKILNHYWPHAKSYSDITKTDFTIHRGKIDILTGGFPCQPFSAAGKRRGTADNRYLWPEMLRAITEIQPRFIVGENVSGLVNWDRGLVFEQVQADLENAGYESLPFLLPACAVDAPHRRDRIWFIAHSEGIKNIRRRQGGFYPEPSGLNVKGSIADTNGRGLPERHEKQLGEPEENEDGKQFSGLSKWENFPTQSPVRFRDDGIPAKLDGITLPKWCSESIKAAGNAIVPQVAFEIFKAIESTITQAIGEDIE